MRQQLQPTCPKVFIYYNWKKSEDKGKGLREKENVGGKPDLAKWTLGERFATVYLFWLMLQFLILVRNGHFNFWLILRFRPSRV